MTEFTGLGRTGSRPDDAADEFWGEECSEDIAVRADVLRVYRTIIATNARQLSAQIATLLVYDVFAEHAPPGHDWVDMERVLDALASIDKTDMRRDAERLMREEVEAAP